MSLKNKIDYSKFGLLPSGATPNERQMEWYNRERMIFFHFGMNTFTDKEWGDGTESPSTFNPTELDVRQWIKAIKDGGFTAAILTAKHHDGFCLWQTEYTEHSIKNSPYKNGKGDIVREFTDACA
jgi:alpha-L-fucosidase